ncbi:hypothetical protein SLS56_007960 [Neofusicoccum ribis]|uniref:Uncharacterized protein n=1 Tax=Neofusicoccum ribis TaxID=45134 RepID=A0ABR3SMF3_9PEZI
MASVDEKSAIQNAPIRVEWKCSADGEVKRLGDGDRATLDFGLYHSRREAYFKLRVPVALKGRGKKTNFYLFIHPERFHSLNVDDRPEAVSPSIRASFVRTGECATPEALIALHISLTEPGILVGPPPNPPLEPKSRKSSATLEQLQSLAQATHATIYLPSHANTTAPLASASTLISSGRLQSSQDEYLLERLYSGKGGLPIATSSAAPPDASPPSYDELGPTPPPPSRRRRHSSRTSSPAAAPPPLTPPAPSPGPAKKPRPAPVARAPSSGKPAPPDAGPAAWKRALETQLEALAAEVAALREGASPPADAADERLCRVEEEVRRLRGQVRGLEEAGGEGELERRLERRLEERFGEAWGRASKELEGRLEARFEEWLDERLGVAMQDAVDDADVRVEERALEIKDEMQTFVRDELQVVKEELMDGFELGRAVFRVDFER